MKKYKLTDEEKDIVNKFVITELLSYLVQGNIADISNILS